ncbi:hypothetical protein QFC22_006084 [Naganishia vaughanmartiniae]|uniref:Uncharacterized protein n=1 Tax=Naganishia vaughanmartiniae TaxID=1424756 RepID=A0ACC2WNA6_9TREE|nr:hypothetical protein QFC22_006084 [Naganishia vaughanmartiniae]
MPANDLSSSSSSAFRRRFEQIQSESPARVSWTKDRSEEGASSVGGRNGRAVITDGSGDARAGRLSGADVQEGTRRSRMDAGPQESSKPLERAEKSQNVSPRPNGTVTADESPRSRVTFSLPSDAENPSNLISRRQDTASSRRHKESYSPPSPRDPPCMKGSFTELGRSKAGIDMSFSHVQHSTPIRSSDMHGHAVAGGAKGLLGPSSEEDDTLDSTVSSSPPVQQSPMKVFSEARGNDSYMSEKTSLARRTSWPNADEAVTKHAGQSKRRRDSVKSQEDTSAVPPPSTSASTLQQENNTSRGSFKQSPLARWMERSASQEKEEITTPLSHLMKRTISQEKEHTLTPFPLRKSGSISEEKEQTGTPFARRMDRSVSQKTRTPSTRWMERSVSEEKEETWTPLSHRMKRSVSRERTETTAPSSRRMDRPVSQEKVETRTPSPGRMDSFASQEKEQLATPFSRRMSGSGSQEKHQTGAPSSRRMRRSVSQEKEETRTPSPRRLESFDLQEKEETRTPSSHRLNRSVSQEKEQTGTGTPTRTGPLSDSGDGSRADFVTAKVWNTLRSRESSRRESAARAGTLTSVPPGQVFDTPASQKIHQIESVPGQDEQLQGDTAREAFQFSGANNSTHHSSEQVSITFDNVQQSSAIPTPESPKITTPIPYAAVTASPQAQRLARAVTQQIMTWIEQEALRTQEQEVASRAREEAEEVLSKRLRLREDKAAQESRSASWGWWWTVILGYISLLGLFAMYVCLSTPYSRQGEADDAHAHV